MDLYLQLGSGMMKHSRHLINSWGGGTVVMSPRDLEPEQLLRLSRSINDITGGSVLLDPQFYLPRSQHHRLITHEYWPADYETNGFFTGNGCNQMLGALLELNQAVGSYAFILPGFLATEINEHWIITQQEFFRGATQLETEIPLYATIALGADVVRNLDSIHTVLEEYEKNDVTGAYVVAEHPNREYLVEDPNWLANLTELCAGLRLMGKQVIVGYANHQLLSLSAAAVDAICSGTWMNVRSFTQDRFQEPEEGNERRRATWYYCPQALSEFKLSYLDFANRNGVLDKMKTPEAYGSTYADQLFFGVQPSSVDFREPDAFRHYLQCMHYQARVSWKDTFNDTLDHHRRTLSSAEELLAILNENGVRAQRRSFNDIFDTVRSSLDTLEATRGPVLRRQWATL